VSRFWIYLEICAFYFYIVSAIIYLLYIQCRGSIGNTDRNLIAYRYKFDALEYYYRDIDWFAFNFVMLCLHISMTSYLIQTHRGIYHLDNPEGVRVTTETYGNTELVLMGVLTVIRLVVTIML